MHANGILTDMQPTHTTDSDQLHHDKKTVLLCVTKASWGGAQQYVYDLATNLPSEQYNVVVSVGETGELTKRLTDHGIAVRTIKALQRDVSVTKEVLAIKELASLIREVQPDIIHANSSKAGVIATTLGRIMRVDRVIFTAHAWAFNEDRPGWQKLTIKLIHWFNVLVSHESIAVSNSIKTQMNWPFVQKKLQVIHLGRSVQSLADKPTARQTLVEQATGRSLVLPNNSADLWLGSISELHHIKRVNVLIDAVKLLIPSFPTLRYVAVHDGEERARLEQQINALGLTEHVFLVGKIPNAARLIPAFDVFVLPSKSEAFGYVLIEAGLANVAVVASNVGGILDIIIDKKTGLLVEPNDPVVLADAIKTLLTNEIYRTQLATAHHERSQQFTVEAMIEKTTQLYQKRKLPKRRLGKAIA